MKVMMNANSSMLLWHGHLHTVRVRSCLLSATAWKYSSTPTAVSNVLPTHIMRSTAIYSGNSHRYNTVFTGRVGIGTSQSHDHDHQFLKTWIGGTKFAKFSKGSCFHCNSDRRGFVVSKSSVNIQGSKQSVGKKRCLRLVAMSGKRPGLIVFDLDCTLWPHHVDTTVNPPFIQKNSTVVDQDGETITYYPEVPKVLEYLQSEGYLIGAASRTTKPPAAEQLLNFFDWNKYFNYKEIYPGSKVTHFAKFAEQTNVPHQEMLFFDDEPRNIIDMEKEGVKCVLVENGVNLQLVKDSIEKFLNGKL